MRNQKKLTVEDYDAMAKGVLPPVKNAGKTFIYDFDSIDKVQPKNFSMKEWTDRNLNVNALPVHPYANVVNSPLLI